MISGQPIQVSFTAHAIKKGWPGLQITDVLTSTFSFFDFLHFIKYDNLLITKTYIYK